jgi:hypothetical protein
VFVDDVAKDHASRVEEPRPTAPDEEGLFWHPIQMLTSIADLTNTDFFKTVSPGIVRYSLTNPFIRMTLSELELCLVQVARGQDVFSKNLYPNYDILLSITWDFPRPAVYLSATDEFQS